MSFSGFSPAALRFFEGLARDNSKGYWQANRAAYEREVEGSMELLLDALAQHGPFRIFRPYNDVRFAKGRPPYKEQIAAISESEGGAVFYVALSASGLTTGTGYYSLASDQLHRFRRAVDDVRTGAPLMATCASLRAAGYELGGVGELKTAPRGYPREHPRIDLLRRKGLAAFVSWEPEPWLHTAAVPDHIRQVWQGADLLTAWLNAHVGPSELPPEEWGR